MAHKDGKEITLEKLKEEIENFMEAEADVATAEEIAKHGHIRKGKAISWSLETLLEETRALGLEYSEEEIEVILTALIKEGKIKLHVGIDGYYPPVVFFVYYIG